MSLSLATGYRARNVAQLLEGIRMLPDGVIYHHTHNFLRECLVLSPEPPNDFSVWVTDALRDERLGEALAAIDTVRYRTIRELRQALIHALENCHCANTEVDEEREFDFKNALRYSAPTAYQAWTLREFAECVGKISISSIYLHLFEARLRPPGVNDFSYWLEHELGETQLAKDVMHIDPYTQSIKGVRSALLELIDKRLLEESRA